MGLLSIGVTGLIANQSAIATTGNNIANANTPGYSRQEAIFDTQPSQFRGGGFIGKGVEIDTIRRITDQFLTQQLRLDTASFNRLDTLANQVGQLDLLIANESTGLSGAFDSFFSSLQAAADSPTSLPARQLVLAQGELLAQRFNTLHARVVDQGGALNDQIRAYAPQVTELARGIASLNERIIQARSVSATDSPNDLLDQRDEALRQLSELVSYTTSVQDGDIVNVFIGGGQALVLGTQSNDIIAVQNEFDPSRYELAVELGGAPQIVTGSFKGGQVGGLIEYRDQALDSAISGIGLLALSFTEVMNNQHRAGIDLDGAAGIDFFTPIDTEAAKKQRITAAAGNIEPDDRDVAVAIDNIAALTGDEYILRLSGAGPLNYTVVRPSDGAVLEDGLLLSTPPQTITTELGFSVELRAGSFQDGDAYFVRPTRFSAANIDLNLTEASTLALGSPIRADASLGNSGSGVILPGGLINVDDVDIATLGAFANPGALVPPLLIRFTSATTYDVLDNSDPTSPQQLNPPLRNQPFAPNQSNPLLPFDSGASLLVSNAAVVTTAQVGAIGATSNGYPGETITVTQLDANGGAPTTASVTALPNESAATIAARINTLPGVMATANTDVTLQVNDNGAGAVSRIRLNGVDLTNPADGAVPSPLTPDFLADRINTLFAGSGITALSTGAQLQVRSVNGDDLRFEQFAGDAGDSVQALEVNGVAAATVAAPGQELVIGGSVDIISASDTTASSSGGIFASPTPFPVPVYLGYQVEVTGAPDSGDEFTVNFNSGGIGDNRNALALVGLQTADVLGNGTLSILDAYGQLVAKVGAETSSASIDREAAESLLLQTKARRDSISGVNLDEEAAKLIQFEQAYNASAQIIAVARQLFDTLLNSFR